MNKPQLAMMPEQDFRAAVSKQCGFPSLLQSAEDERRLQLNEDCDDACQHPPGNWPMVESKEEYNLRMDEQEAE